MLWDGLAHRVDGMKKQCAIQFARILEVGYIMGKRLFDRMIFAVDVSFT